MRVILILIMLFLCACANKNYQSTTNTDFELAVNECDELSSTLNGPRDNRGSLVWQSYFDACMDSYGYTKEQYKHLWFN